MKKLTIACAVVLSSVAVTGAATAANGNSGDHARNLAAKQCAAEKKADKAAFRAVYGDHAMRDCIKGQTPDSSADLKNASKECKAERAGDPDAFAAAYGDGKNAHGKCVSTKVRADRHEAVADFKNAAQECRAERELDADAFRETYGSNGNDGSNGQGRNAFGKCVSQKVHEAEAS